MLTKFMSGFGKAVTRGKLSILIYHQVVATADPMRPSEPTAKQFNWHMQVLRERFSPLSLTEGIRRLKDGSLPGNAVAVTFDDGYLNNLTVAEPILRKYSVPATVFVATGFSGGENMWNDRIIHMFSDQDRDVLELEGEQVVLGAWPQRRQLASHWLKKVKYLPFQQRLNWISEHYQRNRIVSQAPLMMTPEQVRSLRSNLVTIGAHTVNHPILKTLSPEQQQNEIYHSKQTLEDWLQHPVEHFAYPNGVIGRDLDDDTILQVKLAGFKSAVVTNWGCNNQHSNPLLLQRFTPWDRTPLRFQLRLLRNAITG
ncbi:polysaccharide deacetylase family protein [Bowmanella denitrificans]|uniref:Polysaccharide deacetylase family protein n=1 Tax=Bowmanella denitrificans TaxID=366582 RepID=A0ABN0XPN0_9ALTE